MNFNDFLKSIFDYDPDGPNIHHLMAVHEYSCLIARMENVDEHTLLITELASYLHDIGVKVSKEKYFVLLTDNKTGIIDDKGEIVINPEYYEIHIPNPSKPIFVCYYDYNEETGKCRTKVINSQGTELFTKYNDIDTINLNGIETTMPYEKNLLKYKKEVL